MSINMEKTGERIASLRKVKRLTQAELGQRLNVSFQAVSKWERGETLPDTSMLPELADALETTVDYILSGGERALPKRKMSVRDVREGVECLARMGKLLGKNNILYRGAVDGLSEKMNTDIESMLADESLKECLMTEAILHGMTQGYSVDLADVKSHFSHDKWYRMICEYAKRYDAPCGALG